MSDILVRIFDKDYDNDTAAAGFISCNMNNFIFQENMVRLECTMQANHHQSLALSLLFSAKLLCSQ